MLIPLSEYIWGRPVEQYVSAYGTQAAKRRETHGTGPRQLAEAVVQQICQYSEQSGADLYALEVTQKVTLEALDAVLRMSHDPDTFKTFLSPKLASGCITLMTMVRSGEKSLPFRYEYGYLCFRVLLFSLGASVLSRSRGSAEKTLEMMKDSQHATYLLADIFSACVATTLYGLVNGVREESDCDWILGWGTYTSHSRVRYDQIVSRDQARILVDMIWEDRANFLRVMSSTFTPGLSALIFLNWRSTYLEHKATTSNPELLKRATEIHWRCMLTAPTNQDSLVRGITDHFFALNEYVPTQGKRMFEKSPDSRGVIEAYISRLAPVSVAIYHPFPWTLLPGLLEIVVPNVAINNEDLMPTLFRVTLNRLWDILRGEEFQQHPVLLGGCMGLTLEQLKLILKCFRERNMSRPTISGLLKELARGSFLEFVASLLLSLDPDAGANTPADNTNYNIMRSTQEMIQELAWVAPLDLLELHFQECTMGLAKVYHHFAHLWSINNPMNRPGRRRRDIHYNNCMDIWTGIVQTLGQNNNIQKCAEATADCGYALCPNPEGTGELGAYYACPKCYIVAYCSTRCQAGDWERGFHRETCGKITKAPHNVFALLDHLRYLDMRM